ncbi:hypothetical protein K7G19_10655 [Cupriavidus sp. DB3]|uniref:hypothetical protein n=1 Tax=Cupriavidus sp. DB3 TaxID=2873259 RepID=UPI001CF3ED11|nr:hypothetical protein [Cupriavidus sp. DB3]MCA7084065.1 hypothetical protein [Cupriavidus sp. DB3]
MPNAPARPLEATVYTSQKFLQEPVQQPVRRGRLPRAIPRIPTILRERRFAQFTASHQTDASTPDYHAIQIVRNEDLTREVYLHGKYKDDLTYTAEALSDVLRHIEEKFGVRAPQAEAVRPSAPVLRLCQAEVRHG